MVWSKSMGWKMKLVCDSCLCTPVVPLFFQWIGYPCRPFDRLCAISEPLGIRILPAQHCHKTWNCNRWNIICLQPDGLLFAEWYYPIWKLRSVQGNGQTKWQGKDFSFWGRRLLSVVRKGKAAVPHYWATLICFFWVDHGSWIQTMLVDNATVRWGSVSMDSPITKIESGVRCTVQNGSLRKFM